MKTIQLFGLMVLSLALLLAPVNCTKSDKTPPSAATNLRCTSLCSDNTPTFTWDAATDNGSGVDHYSVRCLDCFEAAKRVWVNIGDAADYTFDDPLPDGYRTFEVKAVDKVGNEGAALLCRVDIDTTPPTISSVTVSSPTKTSCSISWTTNDRAFCEVEYGTTATYGTGEPAQLVWGSFAILPPQEYTVNLTGLTANTTYHYRVEAEDLCSNEALSDDYTFTTSP